MRLLNSIMNEGSQDYNSPPETQPTSGILQDNPQSRREETEQVDQQSRYQVVSNAKRYFKLGRVFMTLWAEPKGTSPSRDENLTFSEIRFFVVVRAKAGHCLCVPISTYRGQGTLKHSAQPAQDHAIIVALGDEPQLQPGESELTKKPLKVICEDPTLQKIHPASRINFGKVYTIEYNIKVRTFGRIATESLPLLQQYFLDTIVRPRDAREDTSRQSRRDASRSPDQSTHRLGTRFSFNTQPSTPAFSVIASAHTDESFKPGFRTPRGERTGETLYQTTDDPERLTKLQLDDTAQTTQANTDRALGSFTSDADLHYQDGRQNAPSRRIERAGAWQKDESGRSFRILVIEGIQYTQYEHDPRNVRPYREQPTAQNKKKPLYDPTNDLQRVKSAPETQHHNVHYATYTSAQYPASTNPTTSQPERAQTASFTLFPRENDSEAAHAPSPPGHILPQGEPRSLLSAYGQSFIQITEGDYGSCQEFVARYPGILKENPSDYLKEAVRLQSDGRDSHVRSCVQQLLLLRKVSEMSEGEYRIFLSKMKSRDKATLSAFAADFGVILDAVKKQAEATQSNPSQPLDKGHQSEQVISEDRRQNQISAHLRHAPGPPGGPRVDEGLLASVDQLNLSTLNQQDTSRNYGPGSNGTRPAPITYRSSPRRRGTLTSVDENPHANLPTSNPSQGGAASVVGDNYDIPGVGEGREELDHRYYVRPDAAKFFKVGRVFSMLWHEGAGDPKGGHMSNREKFRPVRDGKYGESVYSHILRMVVVRERHGYCWCIPIHTYHGRGVLNPGFNRQDQEAHAIIHMDDTEPGSKWTEERMAMTKEPIAVRAANRDQKLDVMSRLNFGSPYSVQMNVKVMNVGKVTDASMPAFESYWRNEVSGA